MLSKKKSKRDKKRKREDKEEVLKKEKKDKKTKHLDNISSNPEALKSKKLKDVVKDDSESSDTKRNTRSAETEKKKRVKQESIKPIQQEPTKSELQEKFNKIQEAKAKRDQPRSSVLSNIQERRKLLWGNKKDKSDSVNDWEKSSFGSEQEKKKFLKLMGVKNVDKIDTSHSDDISSNQINMELEKQYNQSIQYSSKYNKRGLS